MQSSEDKIFWFYIWYQAERQLETDESKKLSSLYLSPNIADTQRQNKTNQENR